MKNSMAKYVLCICLLMISDGLMAQYHTERAKTLYLQSGTSITGTGNIASISIISHLPDSTFLGITPSSESNVRTNIIVPSGGVQSWLQSFVRQQFSANFKASGTRLKWVINALSVGTDSSSAGILSFTRLNADVYSSTGVGTYQPKGNFDTIIVSNNADTNFSQNIATAVEALYNHSVTGNYPSTASVASASALQSNNTAQILKDTFYRSGIYNSYQEFLNNAPSVQNFFVGVDNNTHQVTLYQLAFDSTKESLPDAWGLSINNELYRYQDGQLYPIEKDEAGFALSKYLDYRSRKNKATFWQATVGRQQGDGNPYDDNHIYRTAATANNITYRIETTHLDIRTGDLTFYTDKP